MDTQSEIRLTEVWPLLSIKIHLLALQMEKAGEPIKVVRGYASLAEQDAIWAQGRSAPGRIVTYAQGNQSWHTYGLACDCCPVSLLTVAGWDTNSPVWDDYGRKAKALGLFWGGNFSHADRPHVQLTGKFPASPNNEAKDLLANVGYKAVWIESVPEVSV